MLERHFAGIRRKQELISLQQSPQQILTERRMLPHIKVSETEMASVVGSGGNETYTLN